MYANVSLRTVQRIEHGKPMSVETLAAISRAFGLEREELVNAATMGALIPTMERYQRATRGHHVVRLAKNAVASLVHNVSEDDQIRRSGTVLHQAISDWIDVLDLDSQMHAEDHIDECLEELHGSGGRCFLSLKPWPVGVRDQSGKEIELDTLILFVAPDDYPYIFSKPDGEYALTGTEETAKMKSELA